MKRKHHVHPVAVAVAAAALGASLSILTAGRSSASSAQDVSAVEITPTQLSETVHFLEPVPGLAGNLAVSAGDDGILLVDTEMMPSRRGSRRRLESSRPGRSTSWSTATITTITPAGTRTLGLSR